MTGFYRDEWVTVMPWLKFNRVKNKFVKTDIDACKDGSELCWFLDEAVENRLPVMSLFMHSYSLLSRPKALNTDNLKPSYNKRKRLETILEYTLNKSGAEISSFKQLHNSGGIEVGDHYDYVPTRVITYSVIEKIRHKLSQLKN